MTHHLKKEKPVIQNDLTEFRAKFSKKKIENVPFKFVNGKLIELVYDDPDLIKFAKSKGLT